MIVSKNILMSDGNRRLFAFDLISLITTSWKNKKINKFSLMNSTLEFDQRHQEGRDVKSENNNKIIFFTVKFSHCYDLNSQELVEVLFKIKSRTEIALK